MESPEKISFRSCLRFYADNNQQIVNFFITIGAIVGILGVWLTYISIKNSAESVEIQMKHQQKATSVLIVSDFLTEIGTGLVENKRDNEEFNRILVTRTQMLIESLESPELIAQIIRFLGTNDFGKLFDPRRTEGDGGVNKHIDLANSNLSRINLEHVKLNNISFNCTKLSGSFLRSTELKNISVINSDLSDTNLSGSKLDKASIQWTNFQNAVIGETSLDGAKILFSDLTGLNYSIDNSNRQQVKDVVRVLMKAHSLYGSQLDPEVKTQLLEKNQGLFDINKVFNNAKVFASILKLYEKENERIMRSNWSNVYNARVKEYCKDVNVHE